MVKGSVENYRLIHNWVMAQHMQCKRFFPFDFSQFYEQKKDFEGYGHRKNHSSYTFNIISYCCYIVKRVDMDLFKKKKIGVKDYRYLKYFGVFC